MYFITIKRMLEVCFSAHPNIQYRARISRLKYTCFFYTLKNTTIYSTFEKTQNTIYSIKFG